MNTRKNPGLQDKPKTYVKILCEGEEEYAYLNRLKELKVWREDFVVTPVNVHSIDNLFAEYSKRYMQNNGDVLVIYCDTELPQHIQFKGLIAKITNLRNKDNMNKKVPWEDVIFYVYPCTLQITMFHFSYYTFETTNKGSWSEKIAEYAGVNFKPGRTYGAHVEQLKSIMRRVDKDNYQKNMKANVKRFNSESVATYGWRKTNLLDLFNMLEGCNRELLNVILHDNK